MLNESNDNEGIIGIVSERCHFVAMCERVRACTCVYVCVKIIDNITSETENGKKVIVRVNDMGNFDSQLLMCLKNTNGGS